MFKIGTPVAYFEYGESHLGVITKIEEWEHRKYDGSCEYYIMWDDGTEDWFDEEWVELYVNQAIEGRELHEEANRIEP